MENVKSLITDIKDNLNQRSASQKDEVRVMKAMLNDPEYKVGIYDKNGHQGDMCPYEESRKLFASVIASCTKISNNEAQTLANSYEVTNNNAASMIAISKDFVNTYLQTDRKMPLGGRENMNASLMIKHVPEKEKGIPSQNKGEDRKLTKVPAHNGVKAVCPCPSWLKKKK